LIALCSGFLFGAVHSAIYNLGDLISGKMSLSEYGEDIGLGGVSEAATFEMHLYGLMDYVDITTKSVSFGVGDKDMGIYVGGGYDFSKNSWFAEAGANASLQLGPCYVGGGFSGDYYFSNNTSNFNWNFGAGIGDSSGGTTLGLGFNIGQSWQNGQLQQTTFGTNIGLTNSGWTFGENNQWDWNGKGQYTGSNWGLGLNYNSATDGTHSAGGFGGVGVNWYYGANGDYEGWSFGVNGGYATSGYSGYQGSLNISNMNNQLGFNSSFSGYFDPGRCAEEKLQELMAEDYQQKFSAWAAQKTQQYDTDQVADNFYARMNRTDVAPDFDDIMAKINATWNTLLMYAATDNYQEFWQDSGASKYYGTSDAELVTALIYQRTQNYNSDYDAAQYDAMTNWLDSESQTYNYTHLQQLVDETAGSVGATMTEDNASNVKQLFVSFMQNRNPDMGISYQDVQNYALDNSMTNQEKLYFASMIAYFNMSFNPTGGDTHCDAFAAYITYLYNGNADLLNPSNGGVSGIRNYLDHNGYSSSDVSYAQTAQMLANQGQLVYATTPNHIAIAISGMYNEVLQDGDYFYPYVAQQGSHDLLAFEPTSISKNNPQAWTMANSWWSDEAHAPENYPNAIFYFK